MGCCYSSRKKSSGDDSNNDQSNNPNERTRLLDNDGGDGNGTFNGNDGGRDGGFNDRRRDTNPVMTQQKEQEILKGIVQRTADNLIDISAIRLLDRIQADMATERAEEYQKLLATLPPLKQDMIPPSKFKPLGISILLEKLNESSTEKEDEDRRVLAESLEMVKEAMQSFQVIDVGEIVVELRV
ncbi:hypothetical protein HDU76_002174 [Blyttiomyces sp. JEL0837]|nr:hypothetical protein HDU76_002174 [Blyttiomyces sp. JEL0837]